MGILTAREGRGQVIRNRDSGNPGLFCDEAVDEVMCINT